VAKQLTGKIKDERLRTLILELVMAAEQIYGAGNGEAKKDYVAKEAKARGICFGRAELEAAVREMDAMGASAFAGDVPGPAAAEERGMPMGRNCPTGLSGLPEGTGRGRFDDIVEPGA
jgi:hypothetical protein